MPQANETALEQTFSDLAYSHLRDKSQSLLDYLVGFQMLKQEDDGQRAVGIFGFEIDGDYYYAPVFFLNGEIRGLDSLYSVKSDIFVPLTDSWVSTIIDRRQVSLGDPDTRSRHERGIHVPNYSRMKVIPGGGGTINLKLSSAADIADVMMGDRTGTSTIDLCQELNAAGLGGMYKKALEENPRILDQFEQFYTPLDLESPTEHKEQKTAATEEAVVIINSITDEGVTELSDEQKEDVLEGGTIVIDKRPEVAKAQVFKSETVRELENPTGGGLYDVLWSDGSVSAALIANSSDGTNNVFVYAPDREDRYGCIPSCKVFVTRKYDRQELIEWLDDKGMKPSDVKPGAVVAFVSDQGQGADPVCVESSTMGLDGIATLGVHSHPCLVCRVDAEYDLSRDRGNNGDPPHNTYFELRLGGNGADDVPNAGVRPRDPNNSVCQVVITETGNSVPSFTKSQLVINDKCFWAIKINTFRMKSERDSGYEHEVYGEPRYDAQLDKCDFGDYNTVYQALDKVATDLRVWKTGSETSIKVASDTRSFRKEGDGLRYLIGGLGINETDARAVLKQASHVPEVWKYRPVPKIAAELLEMPMIEDNDLGGYLSSFHREQVPYTTVNQGSTPDNRELYQYFSPFGGGGAEEESGSDTFGALEAAGKTGQKDVFDAAALGSLIKNHNPTDLVDRFLPTITSGMDRIGRMLFLIYWHYTDFEDRYGENDLSEFIDNLKAVFEQLGDVIVFAKKRTLAGDPEHFGMGASPIMEEAG